MKEKKAERVIKKFRNKFGGNTWLGADRVDIESFIRKELKKYIKKTIK